MGQSSPGSLQSQAPDEEDGQDDVGEERREVDDLAGGLQRSKFIKMNLMIYLDYITSILSRIWLKRFYRIEFLNTRKEFGYCKLDTLLIVSNVGLL